MCPCESHTDLGTFVIGANIYFIHLVDIYLFGLLISIGSGCEFKYARGISNRYEYKFMNLIRQIWKLHILGHGYEDVTLYF